MAANEAPTTAAVHRSGLAGIEDRIATVLEDRKKRAAAFALLILGAVLVPSVGSNYTLEILTNSFLYIVLCLGLNIVVGLRRAARPRATPPSSRWARTPSAS